MKVLHEEAQRLWSLWERLKPLYVSRDRRQKVYAIRSHNIEKKRHPISIEEASELCLHIGYRQSSEWYFMMVGRLSATPPEVVKILLREKQEERSASIETDLFDDLPDFKALQIQLSDQSDL